MTERGTQIDGDRRLLEFRTYEEYLDSLVTVVDLCYLRSTTIARSVAELGYRCIGETLTKQEFNRRLTAVQNLLHPIRGPYEICSELIKPVSDLHRELALRERGNRLGTLTTIVFLRHLTRYGFEVSGYIDYRQRLNAEDWTSYFQGRKRLWPSPTDLAYYHWRMGKTVCNDTPNFHPFIDPGEGLVFKNLHDRTTISIDNFQRSPGTSTTRVDVSSDNYEQVVLYDHVVRRRL
ncbi:cilia- and flagella-associated protein 299-like [Athalia rosae]|uniref:cilia- and flagella-associated protein 299-like n=1 Tax=Athalia rosae TaxID=37344 RepID=UPI002034362A|nr:cilia- and flagella-associated protein 299-like [Athalia rosae]